MECWVQPLVLIGEQYPSEFRVVLLHSHRWSFRRISFALVVVGEWKTRTCTLVEKNRNHKTDHETIDWGSGSGKARESFCCRCTSLASKLVVISSSLRFNFKNLHNTATMIMKVRYIKVCVSELKIQETVFMDCKALCRPISILLELFHIQFLARVKPTHSDSTI